MNTTAPHTLRKRLLTLILSFAFLLTCLPAALAVDLNVDAGFYFKQSRGGTCTLVRVVPVALLAVPVSVIPLPVRRFTG